MPTITFAKGKKHICGPHTYDIKVKGVRVGKLQENSETKTWFWYAAGVNTAASPTTLDEAKRQAKQHLMTQLAGATSPSASTPETP